MAVNVAVVVEASEALVRAESRVMAVSALVVIQKRPKSHASQKADRRTTVTLMDDVMTKTPLAKRGKRVRSNVPEQNAVTVNQNKNAEIALPNAQQIAPSSSRPYRH